MNVVAMPRRHAGRHPLAGFAIADPTGARIHIPTTADDDHPYFDAGQSEAIGLYYRQHGYAVVRGLLPPEQCRAAMARFRDEVKPYRGHLYRQATAAPERHVFTPDGFMLNPILNVQSLDPRRFPWFRHIGVELMTRPAVQQVVEACLGEPGKLVQSTYVEGNPQTWARQDSYYLDADRIGGMVGVTFAMEDIAPGAGRPFVYPDSHRIDLARNGGGVDVAYNHDRYKRLVSDFLRVNGLRCRAPALRQGDALLWSSLTVNGSLATVQPERSRSSFTAHYIPESTGLLQFQTRLRRLRLERVNGLRLHRPKDLAHWPHRAVFWIETTFPGPFRAAKRLAIKAHTR